MNELTQKIIEYFQVRGLKMPDVWKALAFEHTEGAEVYELLLDRESGWTRNNPEAKPKFTPERLAEELGDKIMMAIVAGVAEGVDPVQALLDKMERKKKEALKREPRYQPEVSEHGLQAEGIPLP